MIVSQRFDKQWMQLQKSAAKERLGHAYIFSGEQNIGKAEFARAFIQAQLCESSNETHCGQCAACRQYAQGAHPDTLFVMPEKTIITIEHVRGLEGFLMHKASHKHKWVLIEEAHLLNLAASQAILKTLEEPINTTFFLITHKALSLLPTIRSRCQILNFDCDDKGVELSQFEAFMQIAQSTQTPYELANRWQRSESAHEKMNQLYELMVLLLKLRQGAPVSAELSAQSEYQDWQALASTMQLATFWQCYAQWRDIQKQLQSGVNFNLNLLFCHILLSWQSIWTS